MCCWPGDGMIVFWGTFIFFFVTSWVLLHHLLISRTNSLVSSVDASVSMHVKCPSAFWLTYVYVSREIVKIQGFSVYVDFSAAIPIDFLFMASFLLICVTSQWNFNIYRRKVDHCQSLVNGMWTIQHQRRDSLLFSTRQEMRKRLVANLTHQWRMILNLNMELYLESLSL